MSPPTATATETVTSAMSSTTIQAEPQIEEGSIMPTTSFPKPPTFEDKYKEREYLKGRLAAAFRIFGKNGYDEGVAGHITLRDPVESLPL